MENLYCLTIKLSDLRDFCKKNDKYVLIEEYSPIIDAMFVELRTREFHSKKNSFYGGLGSNQYNIGIRDPEKNEVDFFFKNNFFIIQNCLPNNFEFCDFFVYYEIPFSFSTKDKMELYRGYNCKSHQLSVYF